MNSPRCCPPLICGRKAQLGQKAEGEGNVSTLSATTPSEIHQWPKIQVPGGFYDIPCSFGCVTP